MSTVETTDRPSALRNLLRAAAGALPFIPRSDDVPDRTLKVEGLQIDRSNVASVLRRHRAALRRSGAADLPLRAHLPGGDVTWSPASTFLAAMGSVHTRTTSPSIGRSR